MGGRPPVDDETANQRLRQLATVLAKVDGQSGSVELEIVDEQEATAVTRRRVRLGPALAGFGAVLLLGSPAAWFALRPRPPARVAAQPVEATPAEEEAPEPVPSVADAAVAEDAGAPVEPDAAPPRSPVKRPVVRRVRRKARVPPDPDATLAPTID